MKIYLKINKYLLLFNNKYTLMSKCPGRKRVQDKNTKWYLQKGFSCSVYTCCEDCYFKYIKGTPQEKNYEEYDNLSNCNCDFLFYKTDCNFEDCSLTENNFRISLIDITGKRFKNNKNEFSVSPHIFENSKLFVTIENLNIEATSYINLNFLSLDNKEINLKAYLKDDLTKHILEIELDPKLIKQSFDETLVKLSVSKFNKLESLNIFELLHLPDGTFIDPMGKPWLKFKNDAVKYKAFLDVTLYETVPMEEFKFNLFIKFNLKENDLTGSDENDFSVHI